MKTLNKNTWERRDSSIPRHKDRVQVERQREQDTDIYAAIKYHARWEAYRTQRAFTRAQQPEPHKWAMLDIARIL
jgi:hypothetical protein